MDHAQIVLSGILPADKSRYLLASAVLEPKFFKSTGQRIIYTLIEKYYEQTGGILTKPVMLELLTKIPKVDPSSYILFEEVYDRASGTPISDHEFKFSVDSLRDEFKHQETGKAITKAFEILEQGAIVEGQTVQGDEAAKQFLFSEIGRIEKSTGGAEAAPEGDMTLEGDSIFESYLRVKNGEGSPLLDTGMKTIDSTIGGLGYGDLALVAGYTSEGKSQYCAQLAWYNVFKQGRSCYYATSETLRDTIIRRIVSRHSREPKFGHEEGLDSAKIKFGTLSPSEEKLFRAVLQDMKSPEYGRLHVSQIPRGATMSYVEARLRRAHQETPLDITIWDYLNLLKPDTRRSSQREEANDILKDAKTIAASFGNGRGIAFVSPWQVSRDKFEFAQHQGFYTLDSLADTSEAEKSADLIFALLRLSGSTTKAKLQSLKCRDGAIPPMIELDIDYRTSYLAEQSSDMYTSMSEFLK